MPRIARVVIPGIPHHIVQRGNRRQRVFFNDGDYIFYLRLLKKYCPKAGLSVWAYCLMPNHIHLLGIPKTTSSLTEAMAVVNWKYALFVNLRQDWRGCLWQGRFYSCPLDQPHLLASTRYIERNPVRAKIVFRAEDYPWSSARSHINKTPDPLIEESPLSEEIGDWESFINVEESEETLKRFRRHLVTGRPLGDDLFVERLERITGRILKKQKTGPKKASTHTEALR